MTFASEEVLRQPERQVIPRTQSARVTPAALSHLKALEAESIYILREAAAEFARPVMLYSIGKDSSVMLRLAQKAFFPGKIPFPLLHIDTSYKFPEMIEFRDSYTRQIGAELIVHQNREALDAGANPFALGTQKCCGLLKTKSLLDALAEGGFDAAFGGARRDEEKSRAKERIYSFRDPLGQWDPKNQRPELWNIFNSRINKGESIRVFPLSNWTELDVWLYIHAGKYSHRAALFREGARSGGARRFASCCPLPGRGAAARRRNRRCVKCRMRSLGCVPCTGAIRSEPTRCRRSSKRWFRSGARSARTASSTTTKKARWRSRSGRDISS